MTSYRKKVFSLRTFGEYSFKQIGDHFRKTESCSKELEMLTSFEDMGDNVDEEADLASVNAPEDGGLDIKINVGNYKNAYATYTMDENGKAIVYFTVEQNLLSACMTDEDSGDKIIRIANNICVSYHNANDELQFHLPENAEVTEVYYVQAKQDELQGFVEGNSTGAQAHLVWKK